MEKLKELWQKIKSIKNYEIIISLIIIAVVLLIYFSVDGKSNEDKAKESTVSQDISLTEGLEERVGGILNKIEGVGEVDVLITFNSTAQQITAQTENKHSTTTSSANNSTTTSTSTSSPIISNQNVIVLQEKMPEIIGVIVVAEGADNPKVRLNILSAVSTALDIDKNSIQIYTRSEL